jgi:PIN domain nuclease of toxin-antitoxin system
MRVLLDTCTFLWIALDSSRLSVRARELFRDPANEVRFSVISAWEIGVKWKLGRLPLPAPPRAFLALQVSSHRMVWLPLEPESSLQVADLPELHKDPFDRMLVAQALTHELTIVTPDPMISRYPAPVAW